MKTFIMAAITVDGFIGRDAHHLADWTSKEDKQLFVRLTKEAGVIVMGSATFSTIGKALPDRRMIVYTSKPETINAEDAETTDEEPKELVERLEQEGASGIAVCGGASIYDMFIRTGVVDELYLTVEPKLFGRGVPLLADSVDIDLTLIESNQLNENTILLRYGV